MARNPDAKAPSRTPTRTCFIGNLPWDVTEPQLEEVFAEIGPVKFFRLVTDRETGKPKGFAFCEYFDTITASAAQRNLNNHEMAGRRIHVDFAEDKENKERPPRDGAGHPGRGLMPMPIPQAQMLPAQLNEPPGMQPIGGLTAGQAEAAMGVLVDGPAAAATAPVDHNVTAVLANMTRRQLYDILSQMKALLQQNMAQARQIMVNNPQLTKALFQAQITLGMVPLPEDLQPQQQQQQQQQQLGPGQDGLNGMFIGNRLPQQQQQQQPFIPGMMTHQAPPFVSGGEPNFIQQQHGQHQQHMQPLQQQPQPQPMQLQQPFGFNVNGSQQQQQQQQQQQPVFLPPDGPPFGNGSPYGQRIFKSEGMEPMQQGQMPQGQDMAGGAPGQGGEPRMQGFGNAPYSPSQQQHQQPQQQPLQETALEEQQKALLEQVMSLSQQQIDLLPPQQKAQVLALQQHSRSLSSRS